MIGILTLVAMSKFPSALSAAAAYERGQRAEVRGQYDVAVIEYSKASDVFPGSTLITARKGIAAYHAGQLVVAIKAFAALANHKVPPEIVREVDDTMRMMTMGRKG